METLPWHTFRRDRLLRDGRPLLPGESDPEVGLPPDALDRADASAIALPMRSSRRSASK